MSHPPLRDDPRDAHLLAALRHAPDRDVAPPAALTAAILDRAQQALQPPQASRPKWRDALRGFFDKLWQPAPMAAFGTLAMATLIGVMWGTQDMPEATPSLRPELAAAPAESGSAPGVVATATVAQGQLPAAGAREALAVAAAPRATTPVPPSATKAAPAANAVAARALPPVAPAASRQEVQREAEAQRGAGLAVTTPSPAQATDAAGAAPAPAPGAGATQTAAVQSDATAKSQADAARAPARARSELAAPALGAVVSVASSPLARATAEIDAAIDGDAARVRWRVNAQRLVAHDAAQRDWWAGLARGTQGRWQLAALGSASGAESEPITLLIDGAARGSLSFEPQALVWRDASGVAWRASVAALTLRGWQEAITLW